MSELLQKDEDETTVHTMVYWFHEKLNMPAKYPTTHNEHSPELQAHSKQDFLNIFYTLSLQLFVFSQLL